MESYEVLKELKRRIKLTSQREVARSLGMTPQFINDVIKGRREVSENLARGLGFERVINFVKVKA